MYVISLAASDLTFSLINGFPLMTVACFNKGWFWGDTGRFNIDSVFDFFAFQTKYLTDESKTRVRLKKATLYFQIILSKICRL